MADTAHESSRPGSNQTVSSPKFATLEAVESALSAAAHEMYNGAAELPHQGSLVPDFFRSICSKVEKAFQGMAWHLVGEWRADRNLDMLSAELIRAQQTVGVEKLEYAARCLGGAAQTYSNPEHGVAAELLLGQLSRILRQHSESGREALKPTLDRVKDILGPSCTSENVVADLLVARSKGLTRHQKQQLSSLCEDITKGLTDLFSRLSRQVENNFGIVPNLSQNAILGILKRDQKYISNSALFGESGKWPGNSRKDLQGFFNEKREAIFLELAHNLEKAGPAATRDVLNREFQTAAGDLFRLHEQTESKVKLFEAASQIAESIKDAHQQNALFTESAPLPLDCRKDLQKHFTDRCGELLRGLEQALNTHVATANVGDLQSALKGVETELSDLLGQTNSIVESLTRANQDLAQIHAAEPNYSGRGSDGKEYVRVPHAQGDAAFVPSEAIGQALKIYRDATVGKAKKDFAQALTEYLDISKSGDNFEKVKAAVPALTASFNKFSAAAEEVANLLAPIGVQENIDGQGRISAKDNLLAAVPDDKKDIAIFVNYIASRDIEADVARALTKAADDPTTSSVGSALESIRWKVELFDGYATGVGTNVALVSVFAEGYSIIEKRLNTAFVNLVKDDVFPSGSCITQALKTKAIRASAEFKSLCRDQTLQSNPDEFLNAVEGLFPDALLGRAKQILEISATMPSSRRGAFERAFADAIVEGA